MKTIVAKNLTDAMAQALPYMAQNGIKEHSRNGEVLVAPAPVMTVYQNPKQHVLFGDARDANPFFHVMEALWMLAGRNDLAFPKMFNSKFGAYSDDGQTLWGAYGWRWKEFFGQDQIEMIIKELDRNPASRRCVLSMWNAMEIEQPTQDVASDLFVAANGGKDVPCNTHAYFDTRGGKLNMTVCNRSNDMIWGAYGANAVHFSILQEYIAEKLGYGMGEYRQFSNNFHIYTDIYPLTKLSDMLEDARTLDMYAKYPDMKTIPLECDQPRWEEHLERFLNTGLVNSNVTGFLKDVAAPLYAAWFERKSGNVDDAITIIREMVYSDWQIAALDWMIRHGETKTKKVNKDAA